MEIWVAFFLTACYNNQRCEKYGPVAQLGECYIRIVEVESSNLFRSTKKSLLEPLSKSKVSGEDFFISRSPADGVFASMKIGDFAAMFRVSFYFMETRIIAFYVIFPVAGGDK